MKDRQWSKAVQKFWNNCCPHCGYANETCTAAHIVGRSNLKTRLIVENGIWACNELHRMMEKGEKIKKRIVDFYCKKNTYHNLIEISRGIKLPEDFCYTKI